MIYAIFEFLLFADVTNVFIYGSDIVHMHNIMNTRRPLAGILP